MFHVRLGIVTKEELEGKLAHHSGNVKVREAGSDLLDIEVSMTEYPQSTALAIPIHRYYLTISIITSSNPRLYSRTLPTSNGLFNG